MMKFLLGIAAVAASLLGGLSQAFAQASDVSSAPLVTLTAAGPATTNSVLFEALGQGLTCMFLQSAHTGTTQSTTFSIQQNDLATGGFFTLATSAAITADATPSVITIYPVVGPASVPTGMIFLNYKIPPLFRVQVIESGSASTITAKVGCTVLK
jgi:hypothetical protein